MGVVGVVWFNKSKRVPVVVAGAVETVQFTVPDQFPVKVTRQESIPLDVVRAQLGAEHPYRDNGTVLG